MQYYIDNGNALFWAWYLINGGYICKPQVGGKAIFLCPGAGTSGYHGYIEDGYSCSYGSDPWVNGQYAIRQALVLRVTDFKNTTSEYPLFADSIECHQSSKNSTLPVNVNSPRQRQEKAEIAH